MGKTVVYQSQLRASGKSWLCTSLPVSVMGGFGLDVVTGNICTMEIDKCLWFIIAPPISSQCQAPVLKDFLTCYC